MPCTAAAAGEVAVVLDASLALLRLLESFCFIVCLRHCYIVLCTLFPRAIRPAKILGAA